MSPEYRPEIDGLRAVAVMAVVLFHMDLGFPGGYAGVDVFFVISGYLITRLITDQKSNGSFSLASFWERRLRRLFPAMAAVLVFTSIAGYRWLLPDDFHEYGESLSAQLALASNVFFWMRSGYFDSTAIVKPLLHTWSLAVEEQFYLLFPLVFLVRSRPTLVGVIAAIAAASFVLSVWGTYHQPSATFYLLPARAWELGLGALVFFMEPRSEASPAVRRLAAWAGLAAIVSAFFVYSETTRFPGASALLPCGGAALFIWATAQDESLVSRALSLRPLVFVGLISYSLYLWHWPLIVFWKYLQPRPELSLQSKAALIAISFLAASASYYLIESPVRRRRVLKSSRALVWSSLVAALAFACIGGVIDAQGGVPSRLPRECARMAVADVDPVFFQRTSVGALRRNQMTALTASRVLSRAEPVHVLLWGDSHASSLGSVIKALATEHQMTAVMITHPSTAPLLEFSRAFPYSLQGADARELASRTVEFVRDHAVRHVVLAGKWAAYASDPGAEPGSPARDRSFGEFPAQLRQTVEAVQAAGAEVWLVKDVPFMAMDVPKSLSRVCTSNGDLAALRPSAQASASANLAVNTLIDSLRSERVHTLDPLPLLVDSQGRVRMEKDSYSLFQDESHLTIQGAELLRSLFAPVFQRP